LLDLKDDYSEFKNHCENKPSKIRVYHHHDWKFKETIEDTYYHLYVDNLIRNASWLYKTNYSTEDYYILSCLEGPACAYKLKVIVKEVEKKLHEDHYLFQINENVFSGKVHQLEIYENNKPQFNHRSQSEIKKEFENRIKGLSKFAITIIEKLQLYLQKQVDRIDVLKKFLGNNYDKHVPSLASLTDCCYKMKEAKFGKDFNNTLGDFQDLKAKYSFEKTNSGQDLFIIDLKEDQKDFVIVFSCRHFLEHAIIQESSDSRHLFVWIQLLIL